MKVLIIGSRIPFPLHDGGAIATYNLLRGLSDIGIETTYISLNTQKHFVYASTIQKEFSFLKSIIPFEIDTKINPIKAFLNLFGKESYNIERFYNTAFEALLLDHLKSHAYDVIHFEGLFVTPYVNAIKKQVNTPLLLRQHNIEYQIWERLTNNQRNPFKKSYLKILTKRLKVYETHILFSFDRLVSIADTDEQVLKLLAPHVPSNTIPGGFIIDKNSLATLQLPVSHSIYHIGSMEWLPNRQAMEWFHEAVWPKLIQKMPDLQFFMAGKNMPSHYQTWSTDQFHVEGEVTNAKGFAQDKSILIVPLQSGSGIRMKTIEAMLQGKAVVTTSIGAQGLPIENKVHCMVADSAEAFAAAILSLFENENNLIRMGQNAQNCMLQHYDNHKVSEQWRMCYQSMLR